MDSLNGFKSLREHLNNAGMTDFSLGRGPANVSPAPTNTGTTNRMFANALRAGHRPTPPRCGMRPEAHPFVLNLATDSSSFVRAATASLSGLEHSQQQVNDKQEENQLPVEHLAQTLRSSSLSTTHHHPSSPHQVPSGSQANVDMAKPLDGVSSPEIDHKHYPSGGDLNIVTAEVDLAKLSTIEEQLRSKQDTYARQLEETRKRLANTVSRKVELEHQKANHDKTLSETLEELKRIDKLCQENDNSLQLTKLEARAIEEKYTRLRAGTLQLAEARTKANAQKVDIESLISPVTTKLIELANQEAQLEEERLKAENIQKQLEMHLKKLEEEKAQLSGKIERAKAEEEKKAADAQTAREAKKAAEAALAAKKAAETQAALEAKKAVNSRAAFEAQMAAEAQATALEAKKLASAKIAETKAAVAQKAAEAKKVAEAQRTAEVARKTEKAQANISPLVRNPGLSASIHAPPEFRATADMSSKSEPQPLTTEYTSTFNTTLQGSKYAGRSTPFDTRLVTDRSEVMTEHQDTFTAWPQAGERPAGTSVIRRIHLRNLPRWANLTVIAGLVWGGDLQDIFYQEGDSTAQVVFLRAEDCQAYHTATSNGIECPGEPGRTIYVDLHHSPDPVHQLVRDFIARGHTRCVRGIPPGDKIEFTPQKLVALASGQIATGGQAYRIESVLMGPTSKKKVAVLFRFGSISDATYSYAWLRQELDHYQFIFDGDPCRSRNQIDEASILGRRNKVLKKAAATVIEPTSGNA